MLVIDSMGCPLRWFTLDLEVHVEEERWIYTLYWTSTGWWTSTSAYRRRRRPVWWWKALALTSARLVTW